MPTHLHEDHVGTGLSFSGGSLTATGGGGSGPLVFGPQRYLDANDGTNATTSFIDFDTEVNVGPFTLTLRDEDHAAGMHYWIRVTSNSTTSIQIQRPATGSTKTISGRFAGFTMSGVLSFNLFKEDGFARLRPEGANWIIY